MSHRYGFLALWLTAVWAAPPDAPRWALQYEYQQLRSSLTIRDVQFPSPTRGIAVGYITRGNDARGVALVTSDGGGKWQQVELKEPAISLFFLNEHLGWAVTSKGLWKTTEAGRDWTKMPKVPCTIARVHFLDESNGFAACAGKKVLVTHDGGKKWADIPEASEPPGDARISVYFWISFATPQLGIIAGRNAPPLDRRNPPVWLEPDAAFSARETPRLSYLLETGDGGKTWKPTAASIFGTITRIRFGPRGKGLGLVEHALSFEYPSEVFHLPWPSGDNNVVFRDPKTYISDVWVTADGTYYLAGVAVTSKLRTVVPQKVRVLRSTDLKNWTNIPVDYRATANRVTFAGAPDGSLWIATNTGSILKLVP